MVKGFVFNTKTGEVSIHCQEIVLLSKSIAPMPEKFHGLSDLEARYRQRFIDFNSTQSDVEAKADAFSRDILMNAHAYKEFVMKNDYSFGVPIVINSPALFRAWRRGI